MKPYIKPVFEKVELMPNERLSYSSCREEWGYCDSDKDNKFEPDEIIYTHAP